MTTSNPLSPENKIKRRAALLTVLLFILLAASAGYLLYSKHSMPGPLRAHIYFQGELLTTIDLSTVMKPYTFTVETPAGGSNTIGVNLGSIAVIDADCPDRLCVLTGYTDSSLLPIICLPHGLIIRLETESGSAPDIISY